MSTGGAGYYDSEAAVYDETRGGQPRARAAADAVVSLVPAHGTCVDVAGGTGIVSAELAAHGLFVIVSDLSPGMVRVAADRLPGRAMVASADRLPIAPGSVDLVTTIWLLHLLPVAVADRVVEEAARVLRPGGHFVTTVDKELAHGRRSRTGADRREHVEATAARFGMEPAGATSFAGTTRWGSAAEPDGGRQVFAVSAFRR